MGFGRVGKGRVGLGLGVGEGYIWGWVRSGWFGCGFGLVG